MKLELYFVDLNEITTIPKDAIGILAPKIHFAEKRIGSEDRAFRSRVLGAAESDAGLPQACANSEIRQDWSIDHHKIRQGIHLSVFRSVPGRARRAVKD